MAGKRLGIVTLSLRIGRLALCVVGLVCTDVHAAPGERALGSVGDPGAAEWAYAAKDRPGSVARAYRALRGVQGAPLLLDVKRLGAVGDGLTNDRPAIQFAIDLAASLSPWLGRVTVQFPPGDYLIDGRLEAGGADFVALAGAEAGASRPRIILDTPDEAVYKMAIQVHKGATCTEPEPTEGFVIADLVIVTRDARSQPPSQAVVQLNTGVNCALSGVDVLWDASVLDRGPHGGGIGVACASDGIVMENVLVDGMTKAGIWISWANNVFVNDVETRYNDGGGIGTGWVENVTLQNVYSHHNGVRGIDVNSMGQTAEVGGSATGVVVTDSWAWSNGRCVTGEVDSIWCSDSTFGGIFVGSQRQDAVPTNVQLTRVYAVSNTWFGATIRRGDGVTVKGLMSFNNQRGGLDIDGTPTLTKNITVTGLLVVNNNQDANPHVGGLNLGPATDVTIEKGYVACLGTDCPQIHALHLNSTRSGKANGIRLIDIYTLTPVMRIPVTFHFSEILNPGTPEYDFEVATGCYRFTYPGHPDVDTDPLPAPVGSGLYDTTTGLWYAKESGADASGWVEQAGIPSPLPCASQQP